MLQFTLQVNVKLKNRPVKQTSTKGTIWTRKEVRATVVTAGHCTHAELTNKHALASCYSCCVHSRGLC